MKKTVIGILLLLATPAFGETLAVYVGRRAEALPAKVKLHAAEGLTASKQTTPPATSSPESLLDETSAADLFSAAFTLARMGSNGSGKTGLKGGSATAFAILAAAKGQDPLEPVFYNGHAAWRRWSFAVGSEAPTSGSGDVATYQAKWKIIDKRDASMIPTKDILPQLDKAAFNLLAAEERVRAIILASPAAKAAISRQIGGDVTDANLLGLDVDWERLQLPSDTLDAMDSAILSAGSAVAALDDATRKLIDRVRSKPQFAVAGTVKDPPSGHRIFLAEAIYDQGIEKTNFFVAANLSAEVTRDVMAKRDTTYRGALRGRWELVPATTGRRGAYFDLTAEGKIHEGERNVLKAQGKVTIPLAGGIDLPVSVTVANRKELINESRLTGHIGFTFDLAKLTELIKPH